LSISKALDFGCGEADFLGHLPAGTDCTGIDFSEVALNNAKKRYPHIHLIHGDTTELDAFHGQMDAVFSFGVLEHTPDPLDTFGRLMKCLSDEGMLFISCPSFLNVRGVIWMTLLLLWDVPMSLSDKHYLTPSTFRKWAKLSGADMIEVFSTEQAVAQGERFREDMQKRLTNALRDANMDHSRVEACISWFEENLADYPTNTYSGAEMTYIFHKKIAPIQ